MNAVEMLIEARLLYRDSGIKIELPSHPKVEFPDYVRPSSLDGCELRHAFEKRRVPINIASLDPNRNIFIANRMDAGNYMAAMYQEALLYWAQQSGYECEVEKQLIDHELGLFGYADAVLKIGDDVCVFEFKYTMKKNANHEAGPCYASYAFQTLCYGMMVEKEYEKAFKPIRIHHFVVTIGKEDFRVWEITPYGDGYEVHDTVSLEMAQGEWNSPNILNHATIIERVAKLQNWLKMYDGSEDVFPPIKLGSERAWMCVKTVTSTKKEPGTIEPYCPYADVCHGIGEKEEHGTSKAVEQSSGGSDYAEDIA